MRRFSVVLLSLLVYVIAHATASAAEPLIIPQPRQMRLVGEATPLAGDARIGVCDDSRIVGSGVEVIQRRLKALGRGPLPVAKGAPADKEAILVGLADSPGIRALNLPVPKEGQGYAIAFRGGPGARRIILVGRDPTGALYACVTFARLLSAKDGRVMVRPAEVRDWPDYSIRFLDMFRHLVGRPKTPAQQRAAVGRAKSYIDDRMVRFKLNGLYLSAWFFGREGDDSLIASVGPKHEWVREIINYAHDRGIIVSYFASSAVGRLARCEKDPRYRGLMRLRGRLHSWGDDELIRRRFDAVGKALAWYGVDAVFVHHADTLNENWASRSDPDRKRFGDDRVKADANLIKVYTEALRRHVPKALVYATIHPYGPDYLARGAYYSRFFERLGRMMPKDVGIMLREGKRADYEALRRYYRGRPFCTYHEIYHAVTHKATMVGTSRMFTSDQPSLVKTFFFPHPQTAYFNVWSSGPVNRLITVEYVWNVNAPGGAATFNYKESLPEFDGTNRTVYEKILPRVIRELHGDRHVKELTALYSQPFRPAWLGMPLIVKRWGRRYLDSHHLRKTEVPDEVEQLKTQARAGARGVEIADGLLARKDLSPELRKKVEDMRRFAMLFKCLAPAQVAYAQAAREAEGDTPRKALPLIAKSRELLEKARPVLKRERVRGVRWASCGLVKGRRSSRAWKNELIDTVFLPRLDRLEKLVRTEGGGPVRLVPKATLEAVTERVIRCPRRKGTITLDGRLDEAEWKRAPKVTPFIAAGKTRRGRVVFPEAQSEARFLYDDKGLYVGVVCAEDKTDSLVSAASRRDDYAIFRDDQIELFFIPKPKTDRYCQLVLNVAGRQLDMLPIPIGPGLMQNNRRWDGAWRAKTSVQAEKSWSAEVFVPWSVFQRKPFAPIARPPVKGDRWKVLVGRSRRQLEYSAVVWVKSFHDRGRYPTLVFE